MKGRVLLGGILIAQMRNGDEVNPSDALCQHPLSHDELNGSRYIEEENSHGQNGLH